MGFRPRPLLRPNTYREDSPPQHSPSYLYASSGASSRPHALGPSFFNANPNLREDPIRRGLSWGDAERHARHESGAATTHQLEVGRKLAQAVLVHRNSSTTPPPLPHYRGSVPSTASVTAAAVQLSPQPTLASSDSVSGRTASPASVVLSPVPPHACNPLAPISHAFMMDICRGAVGSERKLEAPTAGSGASGSAAPLVASHPTRQHPKLAPLLRFPPAQQPRQSTAQPSSPDERKGRTPINQTKGRRPSNGYDTTTTAAAPTSHVAERGLKGWCLRAISNLSPQTSQATLQRFIPKADPDVLRLHVACTAVAIKDLLSALNPPAAGGLPAGGGALRGTALLEGASCYFPEASAQQRDKPSGAQPAAAAATLGSLLFASPSPTQLGVDSQTSAWERSPAPTTVSQLSLNNCTRREEIKAGVLRRSGDRAAHNSPFVSTRPLFNALVSRALHELDAITASGYATDSGASSPQRSRTIAACRHFLLPDMTTLSVSVVGVLRVLEADFGVCVGAVQRALAEVLTAHYVSTLNEAASSSSAAADKQRTKKRRASLLSEEDHAVAQQGGGGQPNRRFANMKFNEIACRNRWFFDNDSSSSREVEVDREKDEESAAVLFSVMPAARVDVGWITGLVDSYLNDHLDADSPHLVAVPTPSVHKSYGSLAAVFGQFDISKRRTVKTECLRDVKLSSVAVRGGGIDRRTSTPVRSDVPLEQVKLRVDGMYALLAGMPRPVEGAFRNAYGTAPFEPLSSTRGTGMGLSSLVYFPNPKQSMNPRTTLPSRRALTAFLYLFQQLYPVCTTTCSEEQFIGAYLAGSYFDAVSQDRHSLHSQPSKNISDDGEDPSANITNTDGGDEGRQPVKSARVSLGGFRRTSNQGDLTYVRTVEYYAADIAGHLLDGGGQFSVRAVAAKLHNQHGGSAASASSTAPTVSKEMIADLFGNTAVTKRAPKRAFGDDNAGLRPKHTLPLPPLPSVPPHSPQASTLRQLPAVIASAMLPDVLRHILCAEYNYLPTGLLPLITEIDWE